MKKIFFFLLLVTAIVACNNAPIETDPEEAKRDSLENAQRTSMPYNVPNQPDWERGSIENVAIAMRALKAYETADINAMQQLIADSVEFHTDNFSFEGTRDSLVSLLKSGRARYDSMAITMHDYESVKSKKRGEEWVSLWYTKTQKGSSVDSFMVMDDMKIVGGKVAEVDSKARRLPAKQNGM